jgi:hypothetical protein
VRNSEPQSTGERQQNKFFAAKVLPYNVQEENKMLLKRLAAYR